VELADVATVEDDFSEQVSYTQIALHDGEAATLTDAVFLSFAKKKGSNAVTVADTALKELAAVMEEKYPDVRYQVFRNDGQVASEAIAGLGSNLIQSIVIVSLVLLVFLGMRSAVLVATSIPLTLGMVFFVGLLLGESINRITLFALILSLGLLVDSATVVVENIQRHIALEKNMLTAITKAVNEVGIGLLLSTVTSVIVFLPTSQISGMMGEYMGPLSIFVPLALIVALLVAYILIPFLTALVIEWEQRRKKKNKSKRGTKYKVVLPAFVQRFWESRKERRKACLARLQKITAVVDVDAFFNQLIAWYGEQLSLLFAQKKRRQMFLRTVFGALAIVMTFPLFQLVHFRMLPTADKNQFYVYIDAPAGYDLDSTYAVSKDIQQEIINHPQVTSIQSFIGEPPVVDFNGLFKGAHLRSGFSYATLRVNLVHTDDRSVSSEVIVQEIRASLLRVGSVEQYLAEGGSFVLLEDPPGPPVMATFMAKIEAEDAQLREEVTSTLFKDIVRLPGVVDVATTVEEPYFRTIYKINHEKAQSVGVYAGQVAQTLNIALSSAQVNEFRVKDHFEQVFIEVRFPSLARDEKTDLEQVYIKSVTGEMVPLLSVVTPVESRSIPTIIRDNQQPNEYITAELANRSVVYAVIDTISMILQQRTALGENWKVVSGDLFKLTLEQQDSGKQVTLRWGGEWEMTIENFRDLGIAMLVAFILVYAVLVAQFQSFSAPAQIMSTVPLAFVGIMPGFAVLDALNGTFLTATSLIGFIALMGIVVNNAILFLEYFMLLKEEGVAHGEALLQAGKTRLRPILLTSLTTVLGSLTIAGDPVWSGLAWSIVFGLSLSAVLTLGVFPVLMYGASKA
jgi:multidrug efflux pump subunit AcrB